MQKIMIVEDDQAIREELALLLENEGYAPIVGEDFPPSWSRPAGSAPTWFCWTWGCPDGTAFPCAQTCESLLRPR